MPVSIWHEEILRFIWGLGRFGVSEIVILYRIVQYGEQFQSSSHDVHEKLKWNEISAHCFAFVSLSFTFV